MNGKNNMQTGMPAGCIFPRVLIIAPVLLTRKASKQIIPE